MRKLPVDELDRLSVEAYRQAGKHPVVVVLDDVRSAHNVGSAFRTADAFRVEKLYLCGITGTPPHREITKTALGADESVAWEYAADAVSAVQALKKAGYRIIAVEQAEGSVPLQALDVSPAGRYCFIFGNEVFGVRDELIAACDACLEIPQFGTKHSLNVSVSVGIVLWEVIVKLNALRAAP
jgi:tRNA G18 (ribose-2'-O)-methylase SpoU